jgi:pSer/pThr/pTyr-binding forkhead associated (FHA) protein
MKIKLVDLVRSAPGKEVAYTIEYTIEEGIKKVTIGRNPPQDAPYVKILSNGCEQAGEISRKHCAITINGENVLIEDLDSKNGTYIKGEYVLHEGKALAAGDKIGLGKHYSLEVKIEK